MDSLHICACLSGLGAFLNHRVYSTLIIPIPNSILSIVHLEMWNVMITLQMWGHFWRPFTHIQCCCCPGDEYPQDKRSLFSICDRNVYLLTAFHDISLHVHHVRGKDNAEADHLSWLHSGIPVNPVFVKHLTDSCTWDKVSPEMIQLDFNK